MRTPIQTLFVAAALLGTGAAPARGQNPSLDSRWLAYIGCWERAESAKSLVCVVPAAATSAVDLLTIQKGQIVARERITATGERVATAHDDCTGWQTMYWSARATRLCLHSADTCASGHTEGSGVIAMDPDGSQWLYIQGMTLGGQTGVRVQRYREVTDDDLLLPDDVKAAIRMDLSATMHARAAAAVSLATDDVGEAARRVDTSVLEAWLVERGESFTLDAKRLVTLADAGVPTPVIDLMVALSYPKVFAINAASRQGERRPSVGSTGAGGHAGEAYATRPVYAPLEECSMYYLLWYTYLPSICRGFYPGYAFGPGFYPGGYPVTIVFTGNARAHGHVVNGQGYKEGASTNADAMPRSGDWGSVTPASGWSPSSSSSPSRSSSGEQRTAKPRPQ